MQAQREQALPNFFTHVAAEDWASVSGSFAADAVWKIGPASVAKELPNEGTLTSIETIVEHFKFLKSKLWKEYKGFEIHQVLHSGDSLALRATLQAIAADGEPYSMDLTAFVDFEAGTSKVKRISEMVDSAYGQQQIERLLASASA
ncbi:hypothetical protein JCM6882_007614 [Rhodosporidiobolus microsporus]